MAEKATIARPYARAAFAHARAAGALADWSRLLSGAADVVTDARVARLLGNPHVSAAELVDLLVDATGGAGGAAGRNFIAVLAGAGRLGLLPEVAAQYAALRAGIENVVDVELLSALEVAPEQRGRLTAALAQRFGGREVRLHVQLDPSLIGGAIVRAGDLVIDGSLKGRLERLGSALTA
ncbi:MAG: F0F1 ATP synthase subunit delta [Gammaproteobacteria bacterium]|nr:F0F1 ATP synthase subunit delta [Gammaproteobacteria bacterium]